MSAMRIAPPSNHTTSINNLPSSLSAPSAPGLHDTLRAGVGPAKSTSIVSAPDSAHPLESRLKNWEATQESLKMEGLRRTFGMSEALRRGMELKITRDGSWKPACLGDSTRGDIHEDILRGRESEIVWEDIFTGDELRTVPGFHDELERKVRMQ